MLLRVPGEEQQEHPWMVPPGLLLSRSQCQQVASTSRRGGIPVLRAWLGLHPQANSTRAVLWPLLGRCSRSNFSGHFCVVLLVVIRGEGLWVGGARGWADV